MATGSYFQFQWQLENFLFLSRTLDLSSRVRQQAGQRASKNGAASAVAQARLVFSRIFLSICPSFRSIFVLFSHVHRSSSNSARSSTPATEYKLQ